MLAERGNDVKGKGGAENVLAYWRIGVSAYRRIGVLSRYRFLLRVPWAALRAETDPSLAPGFFISRLRR
jgi:hypothetical protein